MASMRFRIWEYLRENPGAIFLLSFQIFLMTAIVRLVDGNQSLSNEIVIYGYYSLVIGVILQFIAFLRER